MKNYKIYMFTVLTTVTVLCFQNCGGGNFRALETTDSFSFCKAQPHLESPFSKSQVQLSDQWFSSVRKASAEVEVTLVVDVACYKKQNEMEFLGQLVELTDTQQILNKAAHNISLSHMPNKDELQNALNNNDCVLGVSENQSVQKTQVSAAATGIDPQKSNQRHLRFIGYDSSRDLANAISRKVVVAVIDSGIEYTHEDLDDRMWEDSAGNHGYNFISNNFSPLDDDGHGTHVAGIIAAEENNNFAVVGLTGSFVELMAVKVLNSLGNGTSQAIHDGIQYAISNNADIINLSVESPGTNALMESAIRDAINAGIVVTMAIGNGGQQMTSNNLIAPSYLGTELGGAISVASVDSATGALSLFSNYSTLYAEIAAPGAESSRTGSSGILSTGLHNGFTRIRGTSQATPIVTASAALLIGYLKTEQTAYTPQAIELFLKNNAVIKSSSLSNYVNGGDISHLGILSSNLIEYFEEKEDGEKFDGTQGSGATCTIN